MHPRFCQKLSPQGGRGECRGARCTRSLVCKGRKHTSSHHRSTGTPGIPARNGFNGLLRALPGDRAFLSPSSADSWLVRTRSGRLAFRKLDAGVEASGPHDFAVRELHRSSARLVIAHGHEARPAIPSHARRRRVHRIPPNVRDDRDTPLSRDGTAMDIDLIWVGRKQDSFCKRGWTAKTVICPSGKSRLHLWSCKGARTH